MGRSSSPGWARCSNIGDDGMGVEKGRAAIHDSIWPAAGSCVFTSGLRNPCGLAWEPQTGALGRWSTSATDWVTRRRPTI